MNGEKTDEWTAWNSNQMSAMYYEQSSEANNNIIEMKVQY